jgi:hypothetical protein
MPFDLPVDYLLGLVAWIAVGAASGAFLLKFRRRWRQLAPRRVKWVNAALSFWTFCAALTAVELYFAVWYDESDSFNLSNVSQHWFARHVHRNEAMFRDARPFPRHVPEGVRRICFVGDSFTFGQGIKDVGDRFCDRIGRRLDAVRPGEFLTSYVGDFGINAEQVTELVRQQVQHGFQMDMIVYTICLNDIEIYRPGGAAREQQFHTPTFVLFRDTYFLNLLYFRLQQARLPSVRSYYSDLAESYQGPAWREMREQLDKLRELCDDHHIQLRIVIFPFVHNLRPAYPFEAAHEQIAAYCRETGLPCLDLKPVLAPHAGEGLTVNRFDAHPNERAHALAAEAIETELLDDLFIRPH